jgi:hypothetical protein
MVRVVSGVLFGVVDCVADSEGVNEEEKEVGGPKARA